MPLSIYGLPPQKFPRSAHANISVEVLSNNYGSMHSPNQCA